MSVSLREKYKFSLRDLVALIYEQGMCYDEHENNMDEMKEKIIDQYTEKIKALFPAQLTEEELRQTINDVLNPLFGEKGRTFNSPWIEPLITALIGKCGNVRKDWEEEFDKQFVGELRYEAGDADIGLIDAGEEGIEKIKEFIRKLIATPTFSGGKCCCGQIEMSGDKTVIVVGKEVHCKTKPCYITDKPEPKPKDRIEEVEFKKEPLEIAVLRLGDKLNEIIRHINKES